MYTKFKFYHIKQAWRLKRIEVRSEKKYIMIAIILGTIKTTFIYFRVIDNILALLRDPSLDPSASPRHPGLGQLLPCTLDQLGDVEFPLPVRIAQHGLGMNGFKTELFNTNFLTCLA